MPNNASDPSLPLRLFMHRVAHTVLTWVMLWLMYIFLDDKPTFFGNPAFSGLASIMDEKGWGLLCGVVGAIGLTTTFTRNWRVRTASAALLSFIHFFIAIEFYRGNPHGTATGPYLGYAILGAALAYSTAHLGRRFPTSVESNDPSG